RLSPGSATLLVPAVVLVPSPCLLRGLCLFGRPLRRAADRFPEGQAPPGAPPVGGGISMGCLHRNHAELPPASPHVGGIRRVLGGAAGRAVHQVPCLSLPTKGNASKAQQRDCIPGKLRSFQRSETGGKTLTG